MAIIRDALVDLSGATSADADVVSYLIPKGSLAATPKAFSPKPVVVDDHSNAVVDPLLWTNINTSVTEGTFMLHDTLIVDEGSVATPDWSEAGVLYVPAITPTLGKTLFGRIIMERSCDFILGIQDATWGGFTLHYNDPPTAPTPDQLIGLRFFAGGVSVIRGGLLLADETPVDGLNWRVSNATDASKQYIIQFGITFTATGYYFSVHLPGIISQPVVVHTETRSTAHPAGGYRFFIDKFSTTDLLGFYNFSDSGFEPNVELIGGRVFTANTTDEVLLSSVTVLSTEGFTIGGNGTLQVRFPSLPGVAGTTLYTAAELLSLTTKLTGGQIYPIDFVLGGDILLLHPVRVRINDQTLTAATAT